MIEVRPDSREAAALWRLARKRRMFAALGLTLAIFVVELVGSEMSFR